MPTYSNLRVKNIANSNPAHVDQIGVDRVGANPNPVYLSAGNPDLAEADMILTENSASLTVAAEDAPGTTSVPIIDVSGPNVTVIDWEVVLQVDEYYDDNGVLFREIETDTDVFEIGIRG